MSALPAPIASPFAGNARNAQVCGPDLFHAESYRGNPSAATGFRRDPEEEQVVTLAMYSVVSSPTSAATCAVGPVRRARRLAPAGPTRRYAE
jgi:hypothetical protein